METIDFDKLFGINIKAMYLNLSHPEISKDAKWILKFFIMHGLFTLVFWLLLYNIQINLKMNDFSQTCKNCTFCVLYAVVTQSYFVIVWYQDQLKILFEMMRKDFTLCKTIEDRNIIFEYANKGKWVTKQWLAIAIFAFSCYLVKNFTLNIYYAVTEEFRFIQFYELQYPEVIDSRKENWIVFLLMYAVIVYFGLYTSIMYVAFVPIGPIFMLHACGQLEMVRKRIDKLFSEGHGEVRVEIQEIAKHLQYIYGFVDLVNECFKVAYELSLKISTIILPITCYEVTEAFRHGEVSMEFITFTAGGFLFSSAPCFYSDLLMEKGEAVRMAIYMCGWERTYDRSARASLLIMLTRALRPVAIRTLFRTVCLDALTDLLHQAYAIFNLMNAAWN